MRRTEENLHNIYNVLIVIPSYHRYNILIEALMSLSTNLVNKFRSNFNFKVVTYAQDYFIEEAISIHNLCEELNRIHFKENVISKDVFHTIFVPKQVGSTIGKIKKDAIDQSLQLVSTNFSPDVILLCDDDIRIDDDGDTLFESNFYKMIDHFVSNNVAVANARLARGKKTYSKSEFPSPTKKFEFAPYLERFMLLSTRSEHLKVLLGNDIDECTVGEDGFLFLKAVCAGYKTFRYTGMYNFIHLQHEHKKPDQVYRGGFEDLVKETYDAKREWKTHHTKYKVACSDNKNVQSIFDDLYHGRVKGLVGREVRPDLTQYIKKNIRIDENGNVVRLGPKEIFLGTTSVCEESENDE